MAKNKSRPKKEKRSKGRRQLPSTQSHIPFAEIRDGIVIMKDGTLRRVLRVSSLNFALKSEDEQRGIIQGYVGFLNSLDFELQIVVQSRKLNIHPYLEQLGILARQQDNELLRKQTKSYRAFIWRFVEETNIMDKQFYIVVPYVPSRHKRKSYWSRLRDVLLPAAAITIKQEKFEQYIIELDRQVALVVSSLSSIGLEAKSLATEELIVLYYNVYNPRMKEQQRVHHIADMQIDHSLA